jgi:hypothetical protein
VKPLRHFTGQRARRIYFAIAVVICATVSIYPQSSNFEKGRWVWKQQARKNKPQVQFTLNIDRQGDVVRGVYSVDQFINGRWQGEDGNQTPFQGHVNGDTIQIEFDPQATTPGYQENVTYSAPSNGRKPSAAVITLRGPTLIWRVIRRPGIEGIPARVVLRRQRFAAATPS